MSGYKIKIHVYLFFFFLSYWQPQNLNDVLTKHCDKKHKMKEKKKQSKMNSGNRLSEFLN